MNDDTKWWQREKMQPHLTGHPHPIPVKLLKYRIATAKTEKERQAWRGCVQ